MGMTRHDYRCFGAMLKNQRGSIGVFGALFLTVSISAGALAVDIGRLGVLRSELQNRADAAAMAGATQLDGRAGARARALAVAGQATTEFSNVPAGDAELTVSGVRYFSALEPDLVLADTDAGAAFLEVSLAPKSVEMVFGPILAAFGPDSSTAGAQSMGAVATAGIDPFICHAPPLMMCDLMEFDPAQDLTAPSAAGRQVQLKQSQNSGSPLAPGNFGLLSLPDGSAGAADIERALAAVEPEDCYTLDVTTATGSKTQKVRNGINARFDVDSGWPFPAPNVINYPRDIEFIASVDAVVGSGNWDIETYWLQRHGFSMPSVLAGASRYQTYLYELGEPFLRNGKQTVFPVPSTSLEGFELVSSLDGELPYAADWEDPTDPDFDGIPTQPVAENGTARRLVALPLLGCVSADIRGHGTYPTDGRYIEVFLTETVKAPPEAAIYGEVVRTLTPTNMPDFHANVRLVR
jgi:hypothetical protein